MKVKWNNGEIKIITLNLEGKVKRLYKSNTETELTLFDENEVLAQIEINGIENVYICMPDVIKTLLLKEMKVLIKKDDIVLPGQQLFSFKYSDIQKKNTVDEASFIFMWLIGLFSGISAIYIAIKYLFF